MPLRRTREGRVGVIRAPVAKTAVVAAAVTPGRRAPVAKTAVVAAAVTPRVGRRRILRSARLAERAAHPDLGQGRIRGERRSSPVSKSASTRRPFRGSITCGCHQGCSSSVPGNLLAVPSAG
jgi:hypothetical protein